MWTRAHFCYKIVHCGIWDWCIAWFVQQVSRIMIFCQIKPYRSISLVEFACTYNVLSGHRARDKTFAICLLGCDIYIYICICILWKLEMLLYYLYLFRFWHTRPSTIHPFTFNAFEHCWRFLCIYYNVGNKILYQCVVFVLFEKWGSYFAKSISFLNP